MTIEPEVLRSALANYRDRQLAEMLVLLVGIAAETHPDLLRKALAQVFDLSAVEEMTGRMMNLVSRLQAEATTLRYDIAQLRRDLDQHPAQGW